MSDKAFSAVLAKYSDYNNIFLVKNVAKLPEHTRINDYTIKLEDDKQPFFGSIYNLKPIEWETLKTYIKTNLANYFIQPSKSPATIFILFNQKTDRNLYFCIDYWVFNN